ncbi:Ig-like domain-containing protein [Tunturiibacter gelidiferens]|uniref:Ig-like domain-containing protein n=1 Tax=Tunturiibacter gelidiferens TaxID=3069689 RepID=UPI003D9B8BD4
MRLYVFQVNEKATFRTSMIIAAGQVSLVDTAASSTPVASAPLSNNVATISVSTLSAGTHNLVVTFGGDSQNAAVTSTPLR